MNKRIAIRCDNIYTGTSGTTTLDGYVVTEGGKILAVGTEEDVKDCLEGAERIDVRGNFLMPGLCDYHVHMVMSGMQEKDGTLRYTTSAEDAAKYLAERNSDDIEDGWILGGSWDMIVWDDHNVPTKDLLDKYFKNRPAFLVNMEGHGAWVNSAALEKFGITAATPDPKDGYFSRDEHGEPTGYLHESAATGMQTQIINSLTDEEVASYAEAFIKAANSYGITSLGDVYGGVPVRHDAYRLLLEQGRLRARVEFYPPFMEDIEFIKRLRKEFNDPMLRCGGVKGFIDGTPEGHTGFMLEDYSDRPGFRSVPLFDLQWLKERIALFDREGIQTRVHACGDAGVKACLDAIEYAQQQNGFQDLRHCVEHLEVMDPDDIPRFGQLGAIASVQPEHLPKYEFAKHPFHAKLGEERMNYCWPFESIRKAGGRLAYGTDSPVAHISPFRGIFRSITRLTNYGQPEGGFLPQERVSLEETLKAYTLGGAFASHHERERGTIEPGKLADLAVINHNVIKEATDREAMFDAKAVLTMVGGEIVLG